MFKNDIIELENQKYGEVDNYDQERENFDALTGDQYVDFDAF